MELIQETWDHNSVTTAFRVSKELEDQPHASDGCEVPCAPVYTDDCGLGWNFAIVSEHSWGEFSIHFSFSEGKWLASYGRSITLFTAFLKARDGLEEAVTGRNLKSNNFLQTILIPGKEHTHIYSWDISSRPYVLFKVTLNTEVNIVRMMMKNMNPPKPVARTPVISPELQTILQRALITGMCFDTKFFARSSRASSRPTEPLYAHSTVLDVMQPALLRRSSPPNKVPTDDTNEESHRDLECDMSFDEYDSDSDFDETEVKYEPDAGDGALIEESIPHTHSSPSTKLREPSPTYYPTQNAVRTIRVHGVALKTLKAMIYHCYTAQIYFSPLKSSAADKAGDKPLLPDHLHCSPKSMYRLADKIGAEELKKQSLESIRSRLSKHNILDEVFSHFTSRYPEVLNMELDLLVENIREPEVVQALPAKMKAVASGAFPYSGEILAKMAMQMQRVK
ncbi:hypothetical protein BJ138DRAFT_1115832 [Hygrophoropsis aurantiaca]|uniref:Uncharacterized protein n=1 Tax=Hygrophoropsis aurantiaca TaxID=72124 RepID=A0ACB8A723_9AGAM|nr:hypothetical protein BJ138DRAFT_1115832 [Hygrophoropsis aurantiaca]